MRKLSESNIGLVVFGLLLLLFIFSALKAVWLTGMIVCSVFFGIYIIKSVGDWADKNK